MYEKKYVYYPIIVQVKGQFLPCLHTPTRATSCGTRAHQGASEIHRPRTKDLRLKLSYVLPDNIPEHVVLCSSFKHGTLGGGVGGGPYVACRIWKMALSSVTKAPMADVAPQMVPYVVCRF